MNLLLHVALAGAKNEMNKVIRDFPAYFYIGHSSGREADRHSYLPPWNSGDSSELSDRKLTQVVIPFLPIKASPWGLKGDTERKDYTCSFLTNPEPDSVLRDALGNVQNPTKRQEVQSFKAPSVRSMSSSYLSASSGLQMFESLSISGSVISDNQKQRLVEIPDIDGDQILSSATFVLAVAQDSNGQTYPTVVQHKETILKYGPNTGEFLDDGQRFTVHNNEEGQTIQLIAIDTMSQVTDVGLGVARLHIESIRSDKDNCFRAPVEFSDCVGYQVFLSWRADRSMAEDDVKLAVVQVQNIEYNDAGDDAEGLTYRVCLEDEDISEQLTLIMASIGGTGCSSVKLTAPEGYEGASQLAISEENNYKEIMRSLLITGSILSAVLLLMVTSIYILEMSSDEAPQALIGGSKQEDAEGYQPVATSPSLNFNAQLTR